MIANTIFKNLSHRRKDTPNTRVNERCPSFDDPSEAKLEQDFPDTELSLHFSSSYFDKLLAHPESTQASHQKIDSSPEILADLFQILVSTRKPENNEDSFVLDTTGLRGPSKKLSGLHYSNTDLSEKTSNGFMHQLSSFTFDSEDAVQPHPPRRRRDTEDAVQPEPPFFRADKKASSPRKQRRESLRKHLGSNSQVMVTKQQGSDGESVISDLTDCSESYKEGRSDSTSWTIHVLDKSRRVAEQSCLWFRMYFHREDVYAYYKGTEILGYVNDLVEFNGRASFRLKRLSTGSVEHVKAKDIQNRLCQILRDSTSQRTKAQVSAPTKKGSERIGHLLRDDSNLCSPDACARGSRR